MGYRCYCI